MRIITATDYNGLVAINASVSENLELDYPMKKEPSLSRCLISDIILFTKSGATISGGTCNFPTSFDISIPTYFVRKLNIDYGSKIPFVIKNKVSMHNCYQLFLPIQYAKLQEPFWRIAAGLSYGRVEENYFSELFNTVFYCMHCIDDESNVLQNRIENEVNTLRSTYSATDMVKIYPNILDKLQQYVEDLKQSLEKQKNTDLMDFARTHRTIPSQFCTGEQGENENIINNSLLPQAPKYKYAYVLKVEWARDYESGVNIIIKQNYKDIMEAFRQEKSDAICDYEDAFKDVLTEEVYSSWLLTSEEEQWCLSERNSWSKNHCRISINRQVIK